MNKIKEDIKNNTFEHIYVLYGADEYMKKLYKNKLKDAILANTSDINYNYFGEKHPDIVKIKDISETMPFFSDKRLIVFEDTDLFKDANDLSDYLKVMPETTYMVFCEKNVDKRTKLYKYVSKNGYMVEMNGLSENMLAAFVKERIAANGMTIGNNEASYMVRKVGTDMYTIENECIKVANYAAGKDKIEISDIDAICITLLENKIFDMIEYIANGNQREALFLYNNLIALKESPAKILRLLTRHFNILLNIATGLESKKDKASVYSRFKIPPFYYKKYDAQLKNYTKQQLQSIVEDCVDIEERFKTGRMDEQIGVELLIIKYSKI